MNQERQGGSWGRFPAHPLARILLLLLMACNGGCLSFVRYRDGNYTQFDMGRDVAREAVAMDGFTKETVEQVESEVPIEWLKSLERAALAAIAAGVAKNVSDNMKETALD